MPTTSPSRNGGLRARSRNTPRSRGRSGLRDTVSFVIVSSQPTGTARHTVLLGSLRSGAAATPRVRIVQPGA